MDYIIKFKYPAGMANKDKSNFIDQRKKFDLIKIKRTQYILDREDYLQPLEQLARKFGVQMDVTNYPELPSSLKKVVEKHLEESEVSKSEKASKKNFATVCRAFLIFYDMYLDLYKNQRLSNFNKKIDEILNEPELRQLLTSAHSIATKMNSEVN
ncbi:MAG: hypothetical protein ACTSRB_15805 [Candidatus Helarchaeota archaeon]